MTIPCTHLSKLLKNVVEVLINLEPFLSWKISRQNIKIYRSNVRTEKLPGDTVREYMKL